MLTCSVKDEAKTVTCERFFLKPKICYNTLYRMLIALTFIKQQDEWPALFFQTNVDTIRPQCLHPPIDVK